MLELIPRFELRDLILTKDALYRLSYSSMSQRELLTAKPEFPAGHPGYQTANGWNFKWRLGRDLNPRPPA